MRKIFVLLVILRLTNCQSACRLCVFKRVVYCFGKIRRTDNDIAKEYSFR